MGRLFSVRNSLLLISGVGTVLLLVLTVGFWLDANEQRRDAELAFASNAIESLFLESANHWAAERGLVHAALYDPNPIPPWYKQSIEQHRRSANEAFEAALTSLVRQPSWGRMQAQTARLRERKAELAEIYSRAMAALKLPRSSRDETLEKEWFPAITGLIVETEKLRLATRFRATSALRDLEALQDSKHATSVMWEFAQRQIALLAGIISAEDPIVLEDVEHLAEFRGRLLQAWEVVDAFSAYEGVSPAVVEQIDRVREDYFRAFGDIISPVVRAGTEGDVYPVTAVEWIHQSDSAIAPILRLGQILAARAANLALAYQADGERRVLAASVIIGFIVLIGGISIWIVSRWVIRPLAEITQAMTSLSEGASEVDVPSTIAQNEIGEMARAVRSFKESMEAQAQEISRTNADLQEMNEKLEDRVRERTEELRSTRDEAIRANKAKSQFLANMSHELRTPLNAIIGFSDIVLEKIEHKGPSDFRDPLARISRAGRHLLRLINDVLDIAKIEAGRMELALEPVALVPLIEETARTLRPMAEENKDSLELDYPESLRLVCADPVRLRQILLNLLSNAIKFTKGGRIVLSARERGETMVISVADSGIGMSAEQSRSVFMEFAQVDASSTRRYGGTGLGLAISQRFCRMMGGEITVESKLGEGSTFHIVLPLAEAEAESLLTELAGPQPDIRPAVPATARSMDSAGALILTVDDDPHVIELLHLLLEGEGYRTETATSGGEGLRLAEALAPDVITLDVMLPDLDGWDVLAALKSNPATERIPVIMMSITDDITHGYSLGAADYITKPVEREPLLAALSRAAGGRDWATILLVEDDEATREVVREVVDGSCSRLLEASDGEEGIERLEVERPDIILLDLLMPKMDGFEFLDRLRRNDGFRDIPVIVVTAQDLTKDDRERLDGAVSQIMYKSAFSGPELLATIRAAVATRLGAERSAGSTADHCILYVEDNEDNVVLLKARLESHGFEVLVARDGREGVEMTWHEKPELILMDMSLPVLDGWDAVRQLKADPRSREIPIIGVSAHAMAGDRQRAIAAGCDDYVTKPIDLQSLLRKVERLVSGGESVSA